MNISERESTNEIHRDNPKVGDYWHEMLCPVLVVVSVCDDFVTVLDKKKNTDDNHWTWDTDQELRVYTRENFKKATRYCYVSSEAHAWVRDIITKNAQFCECCGQKTDKRKRG